MGLMGRLAGIDGDRAFGEGAVSYSDRVDGQAFFEREGAAAAERTDQRNRTHSHPLGDQRYGTFSGIRTGSLGAGSVGVGVGLGTTTGLGIVSGISMGSEPG